MKNYSFERVFENDKDNRQQVVIHRKSRHFNWKTKLLCLLVAIVWWLVVTNINAYKSTPDHPMLTTYQDDISPIIQTV